MNQSTPTSKRVLRPDDPIVPNLGLGGIELRRPIGEIEYLLNRLPSRYKDSSWCELYPPWEVRYLLGPVAVAADVRTGQIFKLLALNGYTGTLFDTIRIGMTVQEVRSLEPRIYFDEASDTFLVTDCPGVALDIAEGDPDPEQLPTMPITSISVYAMETPSLR